jgi:hypothetical protein
MELLAKISLGLVEKGTLAVLLDRSLRSTSINFRERTCTGNERRGISVASRFARFAGEVLWGSKGGGSRLPQI